MLKTAWVKGCGVERVEKRVEKRARAREGASRVCWLKRRMQGGVRILDLVLVLLVGVDDWG